MDFVVVGLGVGALAILLGLTIREAGSRWWSIRPDQPLSTPEQARRLAIGRAGRAGGYVLTLAGAVVLVTTIAAIALGLSDRTGAILVMAVVTVAVLGCVAWGTVYAHRYHPRPLSRTPGRRPAIAPPRAAEPSLAGTFDAAFVRADIPPEPTVAADDLTATLGAPDAPPPADAPDVAQAPELDPGSVDSLPSVADSAPAATVADAPMVTNDPGDLGAAGEPATQGPGLEPEPDSPLTAPVTGEIEAEETREHPAEYAAARKDQGA